MNEQPLKRAPDGRSPLTFFSLVFALSVPISLAGTLLEPELLPGLPASALITPFCPLIAACLLVYRENKAKGVIGLLKRSFDYQRIRAKIWYSPVVLLMPGVMALEYGLLRLMGVPIPGQQFSIWTPVVLFVAFFSAALGEELGWMGYAIDPLQARLNALRASLLLGLIWSVWHFIPLVQAGRSAEWIAWWTLETVAQRVLIVWLYNNTGRSVFAAATYHAMLNLAWQLFPVNGSYYDPRITALIVSLSAVIVTVRWGPKTLAQFNPGVNHADVIGQAH